MKVYEGMRDATTGAVIRVTVGVMDSDGLVRERRDLLPRFDLRNHSPTGFEWGYGGSGPSQLALALCADVLGSDRALRVYQHFKWQHVAGFPQAGWRLTDEQIRLDVGFIEEQM